MRFDLVIKNVNVVTSSSIYRAGVLVKNGKTAGIVTGEVSGGIEAGACIEGKGRYLLPGMVDVHTHIDEQWEDIEFDMAPYRPVDDDIASTTKAAAAGGITTIALMPASFPVVNTADKLLRRMEYYSGRSYVDFALLGGAGVEMLDTIVPQAEAGAVGYKSYWRDFRKARKGLICENSGDLYLTMEQVRRSGRPVGFHAEDAFVGAVLTEQLSKAGRTDPGAWLESRPESSEVLSAAVLLECAKLAKASLHLVHMSSPRAIRLANQWRAEGTDVSIETCPHYLLFSNDDMARWGPYLKVAPPLRCRESMDQLWEQLKEGEIDILATDHAPGYDEERAEGRENIFGSGGGMPALETTMPAMLGAVSEGRLSLERLVAIAAENPARRFCMYPQKGVIQVGADADYLLVDMDREWHFDVNKMFSKGREGARPFHGKTTKGAIMQTILRGKVIYDEGKITGVQTDGRWVKPADRA